VTAAWGKMHNVKLHNLFSLPDNIRMIKSRRMGRACSAHGGDEKCVQNVGWKA
jgi:hypothetical protein